MPPGEQLAPQVREQKRKRSSTSETACSTPQRSLKRRRQDSERQHKTPSSFWDNLSRQWLTRRALREFDRRTSFRSPPPRPHRVEPPKQDATRLKRFARHGGPDLEDLRSFPEPLATVPSGLMSSSQASSRRSSSQRAGQSTNPSTRDTGKKTSTHDRAFVQHLADNGVSMNNRGEKPGNLDEILSKLDRPRPSLSPSRFAVTDFEAFQLQNDEAANEATVMSEVLPMMMGNAAIPSLRNEEFRNLAPLTDGSIVKGRPDLYDGVRPSRGNRRLREELGHFIVPSTNTSNPCVPNFFLEAKGPNGSSAVAKVQACYDGALGARGMHEVRSYNNHSNPLDNNAYTITSTYAGGAGGDTLKLYTTHPTASADPERPVDYRMTQLRSFAMTDNSEAFRQGAAALRNARDWAKEQREAIIAAANERILRLNLPAPELSATDASQSSAIPNQDSDTSVDELIAEAPSFTSFSSNTSLEARQDQRSRASSKQRRVRKETVRNKRNSGKKSGEAK